MGNGILFDKPGNNKTILNPGYYLFEVWGAQGGKGWHPPCQSYPIVTLGYGGFLTARYICIKPPLFIFTLAEVAVVMEKLSIKRKKKDQNRYILKVIFIIEHVFFKLALSLKLEQKSKNLRINEVDFKAMINNCFF